MRPKSDKTCSSFRLPKDHIHILEMAAKICHRPVRELVKDCLDRGLLKCAPNLAVASMKATDEIAPLLAAISVLPRSPLPTAEPVTVRLGDDTIDALADASGAGSVTKTDILTAAVERELADIVREILVVQIVTRDKATRRAIGKWAAHLSRNKTSGLNGGRRVLPEITNSRQQPSRKRASVSR